MKNLSLLLSMIIAGSALTACAQGKSARTSSARAAYGQSVPFSSHAKKNEKARKKAKRSAKNKKMKNDKSTYRRGLPI
jgi:hypothetical protein